MRRIICLILVFVISASIIPYPVSASDEILESKVAEPTNVEAPNQSELPATPVEASSLPQADTPEQPAPASLTSPVPEPQIQAGSPAPQPLQVAAAIPETTPNSIVTTFNVSSTIEYIELYNQSDQPMNIATMMFRAMTIEGQSCDIRIAGTGWLLSDSYVALRSPTVNNPEVNQVLSSDCDFSSNITRIEIYHNDSRIQVIDGITASGSSWFRHASNTKSKIDCAHKLVPTTMKQTGSIDDYVSCQTPDLIVGSIYIPPTNADGLKIIEILPNSRSCLPSNTSLDCSDYIKIKNMSAVEINLAIFRVRTGAKFSSATMTSSFNWHQPTLDPENDELILPAGRSFILRFRNDGQVLNLSGSDGNIWIEDYHGVQSYDEATYSNMDLAAASGKSWAYDETQKAWKFGIPSPEGDNSYPSQEPGRGSTGTDELKPCRDDQYRSEETNRCRNVTSTAGLAPCKEGQYRSEETNRCRSIASSAAATLKPCGEDQFRSPETNRCRKIASSDDVALADCGEGRERNPETNRCRNVLKSTIPDAAFAVEHVKDAGKVFIGWWALGGVGIVALGYGLWEWRREMRSAITKASTFFTSRK